MIGKEFHRVMRTEREVLEGNHIFLWTITNFQKAAALADPIPFDFCPCLHQQQFCSVSVSGWTPEIPAQRTALFVIGCFMETLLLPHLTSDFL